MIELQHVSKTYRALLRGRSVQALDHLSLTISRGEVPGSPGPMGLARRPSWPSYLATSARAALTGRLLCRDFVAAFLGVQLVLLTLTGVYSVAVRPAWSGTLFLDSAVHFAFLGSLIFVFSRFTRLDWLLGMFLVLMGDLARNAYPKDESFLGAVMNVILRPDLPASFFAATVVPWGELSWVLGYAAIAFVMGLITVRVVPMGATR